MDAVDDDELGLELIDGGHNVGQRGLGQQPQVGPHSIEAASAQANLLGAFFGRHIQRTTGPAGQQLQQQRALSDAGLAAKQGDRTRDETAAEHAVEFADTAGPRARKVGADFANRSGNARRKQRHACGQGADVVGRLDLFDQAVPCRTRGTATGPFGMTGTALGATMNEP